MNYNIILSDAIAYAILCNVCTTDVSSYIECML